MAIHFFKDARYFQLLFQGSFLAYGLIFLHWHAEWMLYATYFVGCVATQWLCELLVHRKKAGSQECVGYGIAGLPSALITAFGLSLLLKTNDLFIASSITVIAIASKFVLRRGNKHIFNPSAFGIVTGMLCTDTVWIDTGQWGNDTVLFFGVICLGYIVVTRVQQLDLSIAFLSVYACLQFGRQVIFLGWPIDFFVQSITTGSLLLFSFFMITDPKTTPNHPWARVCWAMAVAGITFYLSTFYFIPGAPVWVLVATQPLVPLLDRLFNGKTFTWQLPPNASPLVTGR